ncbi:helix-turn-helix transcriptional regulator [Luteipulveratus sp. YIM 133132]|uniref:helix-turn-helix domain-containing protein n=1 Tax=Luteipulveratus flavus TaxID=3031728 RepID=UPI0023B08F4B|nr:helix-turn-helix transcriptional regulator [Luteipulveratus sp. YIM 133132]MDE9363984.1 helix-turn-helix transcriptional regulator [Luteipulveratus sp. YIM 133132]
MLTLRGISSASELHRRLIAVMGDDTPSVEQVRRLASGTPERLTLRTLAGLCAVLDVEPGDLLALGGPIEYDEPWTLHPDPADAGKLLDAIKRGSRAPVRRPATGDDAHHGDQPERGLTLFDTEQNPCCRDRAAPE